jgi:hypothetical protein
VTLPQRRDLHMDPHPGERGTTMGKYKDMVIITTIGLLAGAGLFVFIWMWFVVLVMALS